MAEQKIIGIDCSSKLIDAVILSDTGEWIASFSLVSKEKDMNRRMFELYKKFIECLAQNLIWGQTFTAFVESPIYIQNWKASVSITKGISAAILALYINEISVFDVAPTSWKKDILGDGRASKEKVMEFAKARWGDRITSQDIADSAVLALYGVRRIGKGSDG